MGSTLWAEWKFLVGKQVADDKDVGVCRSVVVST